MCSFLGLYCLFQSLHKCTPSRFTGTFPLLAPIKFYLDFCSIYRVTFTTGLTHSLYWSLHLNSCLLRCAKLVFYFLPDAFSHRPTFMQSSDPSNNLTLQSFVGPRSSTALLLDRIQRKTVELTNDPSYLKSASSTSSPSSCFTKFFIGIILVCSFQLAAHHLD